jgi:hypothetical protein
MYVLLTTLLLAMPADRSALPAQEAPAGAISAAATPEPREAREPRQKLLGAQLGAGAPQGLAISAVVRPVNWVRGTVGVAHNILGPGIQASVTALPFQWGVVPTFTLEAGKFFETDVSGRFSGSFPKALDPALQKFGYTFTSAQLGAEFGSQERFVFFVRGGLAWVRSGLADVRSYRQGSTTVDVTNARLSATTPTVNLGFLLYVW